MEQEVVLINWVGANVLINGEAGPSEIQGFSWKEDLITKEITGTMCLLVFADSKAHTFLNKKFDVLLYVENEYGKATEMELKGVSVTSLKSGYAIDDITTDELLDF